MEKQRMAIVALTNNANVTDRRVLELQNRVASLEQEIVQLKESQTQIDPIMFMDTTTALTEEELAKLFGSMDEWTNNSINASISEAVMEVTPASENA